MLLAMAERRLGLADNLARVFPDRRDPTRVVHSLVDMFRARMFAICCGYEDADDLDHLRSDPAFKLACGRLPDTGRDLCSQPTLSRLENAPRLRDVIRLTYILVDAWMDSYPREPASVTLDIDDTCDVVHGHQQLSLFNAHYDERCFLPIHVYDTEKSRPVAVVLRPGKTPGGVEVRALLRRLVRHIRTRWHNTRITFRGDGHYARPEAMAWCETNGIDYIFGLSGTKPLARKVDEVADDIRTRRAIENLRFCVAIPRRATRQSPGIANGAPSPVLRRRCSASTSVSSSPASMSARPSGSTTACIARAAKPRI
ncbi:putative transposase [Bradyrhizobium diazoefficiens]|uniref:Putative transposase n=1 Tax=Bradyrhizobium diazoefficiens TaxID=1355477 RepID=A0A0E4FS17_9BRAD|nr:putative transposase [Bradyrhizobium diazoefficiens]